MNLEKIFELIPDTVEQVRKDYVLNDIIIKDGIFGILEKHCTVVYYPLENEKNRGFHTKRFVKDKLEDFVYINTAKSVADQVFTAAHELGHVWGVADTVWKRAGETGKLMTDDEERIINRFAAELLMPAREFKQTFRSYIYILGLNPRQMKLIDLVRVMVLQMNVYMVPYESVRRRLKETDITSTEIDETLKRNETIILEWVEAFSKDQNTMLDRVTAKKAIPGLRKLVEKAEISGTVSKYTICRIKKDFDIGDINASEEVVDIFIGDNYGEN